jgi:hypothetical protein
MVNATALDLRNPVSAIKAPPSPHLTTLPPHTISALQSGCAVLHRLMPIVVASSGFVENTVSSPAINVIEA